MFKEFYFKILIPVKDTANPLSHHALASSNFFNWMQALAPVKAKINIFNELHVEKKIQWLAIVYVKMDKLLRIIIENWRNTTDLKNESHLRPRKHWTIKKKQ